MEALYRDTQKYRELLKTFLTSLAETYQMDQGSKPEVANLIFFKCQKVSKNFHVTKSILSMYSY